MGTIQTGMTSTNTCNQLIIQADGRILIVGHTYFPESAERFLTVRRYNANGAVDASFASNGLVHISFGAPNSTLGSSIALQEDGKIIAGGSAWLDDGSTWRSALVRLNPNGSIDTSFGIDGRKTGIGGREIKSIRVDTDGKIILAGIAGSFGASEFFISRLTPEGFLDSTFSGDGRTYIPGGKYYGAYDLAIQQDGKTLVVGSNNDNHPNSDFTVARVLNGGNLDYDFSENGIINTDLGGYDIAHSVYIQQDGRILVAGVAGTGTSAYSYDAGIVRYDQFGNIDKSFGSNGIVHLDIGVGRDIAIQRDGKILVIGDKGLARITADGTLDQEFGSNGISLGAGGGWGVDLQMDGKIIVATGSGIARYDSNGDIDTSFGGDIISSNGKPVELNLTATSFNENTGADTTIATLSTIDHDGGDTHTYALVTGTGGTDNSAFTIDSNQLKIKASPDFESKNSYSIRLQTKDSGGLTLEKTVILNVTNINEVPSALNISSSTFDENITAGSAIATLSSTDPDSGDSFTYALVAGTGDDDNAAFSIDGNQLNIKASPDFESKSSYSIRLQTKDSGGLTFEKDFKLTVLDLPEVVPIIVRGDSLYKAVQGPSWAEAQENAKRLGGDLATISSESENKFIVDTSNDINAGNPDSQLPDRWWIGRVKNGINDWEWNSDEAYDYTSTIAKKKGSGPFLTYEPVVEQFQTQILLEDHVYQEDGQTVFTNSAGSWIQYGYPDPYPSVYDGSIGGLAEIPFIRRDDSAYVIVEGPTWEEAEANAVALGGHLVTINDAEENEWLIDKLGHGKWIGISDHQTEDTFTWSSGESVEYVNWAQGEPNNAGGIQDYGWLQFDDGRWDDEGNIQIPGIAEIKLAPNNTPTGIPTISGDLKVGSTLTIDASGIQDADNFDGYTPIYQYTWESSTDGTTWTALTSTDSTNNNNTYTLTELEVGRQIRGVVSYVDGYGTNETTCANAVQRVDANDAIVNVFRITFSPKTVYKPSSAWTYAQRVTLRVGQDVYLLNGVVSNDSNTSMYGGVNTWHHGYVVSAVEKYEADPGNFSYSLRRDPLDPASLLITGPALTIDLIDIEVEQPSVGSINPRLVPGYEINRLENSYPQGTPTISGDLKVGSTLTIDASGIQDADNHEYWTPTYQYTWEIADDPGMTQVMPVWEALTTVDATDGNETLEITEDLTGKLIRGVVSYLDGYGTNEVLETISSGPIEPLVSLPLQQLSAEDVIKFQREQDIPVPIYYGTSDGTETTGLSFRFHYNSTLLNFDASTGINNKATADLFQVGGVLEDTEDFDGDSSTDRYIPVTIASFSGKLPSGIKLADLTFTATETAFDPITGLTTTAINFSEQEVAQGYGFASESATLIPILFNLDVDGDGKVTALGDGLMIIRKLFGTAFAGDALTNKAVSPTATRTTDEIHSYIQGGIDNGLLDVDKDGKTTALGDGLMVIRHMFGNAFAGDALISKAISPTSPYFGNANAASLISSNIDSLRPVVI